MSYVKFGGGQSTGFAQTSRTVATFTDGEEARWVMWWCRNPAGKRVRVALNTNATSAGGASVFTCASNTVYETPENCRIGKIACSSATATGTSEFYYQYAR